MANISDTQVQINRATFVNMLLRYWAWRNSKGTEPNIIYTKPNQQGDYVNLARFNDMRLRYEKWEGANGSPPNFVWTIPPADNPTTPTTEFPEYLVVTANCQVNDPTIQSIAKQIGNGGQGVLDWVLGLEYDFYYDTLRGALKTIQDGIGDCCDLTHVLVALARAKEIPARYVHNTSVKFTSITCGHVWAELYINGSWIRADASNNSNTLGNNPKDSMLLGTTKRYAELPF